MYIVLGYLLKCYEYSEYHYRRIDLTVSNYRSVPPANQPMLIWIATG